MEKMDGTFEKDYERFLAAHPSFRETFHIDQLRSRAFKRIEESGHVYLDFTGASLYSEELVATVSDNLRQVILANPHSHSPPSRYAAALVEDARERVLQYFNADPGQYEAIFTSNASAAIRLVAESFPFDNQSNCLLTVDNHNSVLGLQCYARQHDADVSFCPIDPQELRIDGSALRDFLGNKPTGPSLFAYPAQSNYSGVKHSLHWLKEAKDQGWRTLLDAAAYVPTNVLDLTSYPADFVCISFYKMFGFPTGVGCLLARHDALKELNRPWFSGGSVLGVSVVAEAYRLAQGHAGFEDGTVNFALLPAINEGLQFMDAIDVRAVAHRCQILTAWLLSQMSELRHASGCNLVRVLGPANTEARGATIALQLVDPEGVPWQPQVVELHAGSKNISLRTGYHCNPGCNEVVQRVGQEVVREMYRPGIAVEEMLWRQEEHLPGVIRASLGSVSNFKDVWSFVQFLKSYIDQKANSRSMHA